jgi:hypothetical protein
MLIRRYVVAAGAVAAVLVVALAASFFLRDRQQVTATPQPTQTSAGSTPASSAPVAATASPFVTASAAPGTATSGIITGRLGYPSDFIPPLTIYAVSVSDRHVFYAVKTPRYGNDPSAPPTPGPPIPPYTLVVAPGTYEVYAYREDGLGPNVSVVVYSQYTVKCQQASPAPTGPCQEPHTLVPVTVRTGETVGHIDLTDWFCNIPGSTCPARPQ